MLHVKNVYIIKNIFILSKQPNELDNLDNERIVTTSRIADYTYLYTII